MKEILIASVLGSLASISPAQTGHARSQPAPRDRVAIFQVPLRCPAAPQIGCGSSAKPILLELERAPEVSEAWLNRAGSLIAVVWKSKVKTEHVLAKLKSQASAAECCANGSDVTEVRGAARDAALKEFEAGGWYRGADVDRLSEEEAAIIAARVVRGVEAKTPLAAEKAKGLRQALSEALRKRLINGDGGERGQSYEPEFRRIASEFLDERQTLALKEAIENGLRSSPDEK